MSTAPPMSWRVRRFTLAQMFGAMGVAALVFAFVHASTFRGALTALSCILFAGAIVGIPTRRPRLAIGGGLLGAMLVCASYGFSFWHVVPVLLGAIVGATATALSLRGWEPPYVTSKHHPVWALGVSLAMTIVNTIRLGEPPRVASQDRFPWELFLIPLPLVFLFGSAAGYYTSSNATCLRCRDVRLTERWFGRTRHTIRPSCYSAWFRANNPEHECQWRPYGDIRMSNVIGFLSGSRQTHPIWQVPPEWQEVFLRQVSEVERKKFFALLESSLPADQQAGADMANPEMNGGRFVELLQ